MLKQKDKYLLAVKERHARLCSQGQQENHFENKIKDKGTVAGGWYWVRCELLHKFGQRKRDYAEFRPVITGHKTSAWIVVLPCTSQNKNEKDNDFFPLPPNKVEWLYYVRQYNKIPNKVSYISCKFEALPASEWEKKDEQDKLKNIEKRGVVKCKQEISDWLCDRMKRNHSRSK